MDPLALLREYCVANKLERVVQNGTRIDFDDLYSFESSTLTRFRSRDGHYALGTVFFFLKNRSTSYGQYFQQARKENLETVTYVHKKPLLDYLEGKVETCAEIDTKMPNLPASTGAKRPLLLEKTDKMDEASDKKKKILKTESGTEPSASLHSDELPENPDDWTIEQIYAQEKGRFDSRDCMRTRLNFAHVLTFARELLSEKGKREKKMNDAVRQPRRSVRPIILVPHGMTAILSMYNVKEFLENGKYIFPEQVYKSNPARDVRALVKRSFDRDPPVHYLVSEKVPCKEDKETWKRVIAVVVTGKPHQFKEYPYEGCDKGDVYDLLHNHVQGFYFQYHDDNFSESEAATWKVKVLTVHRHHRHGDNLLMQQFWRELDSFIKEKKLDRIFKY